MGGGGIWSQDFRAKARREQGLGPKVLGLWLPHCRSISQRFVTTQLAPSWPIRHAATTHHGHSGPAKTNAPRGEFGMQALAEAEQSPFVRRGPKCPHRWPLPAESAVFPASASACQPKPPPWSSIPIGPAWRCRGSVCFECPSTAPPSTRSHTDSVAKGGRTWGESNAVDPVAMALQLLDELAGVGVPYPNGSVGTPRSQSSSICGSQLPYGGKPGHSLFLT